MNNCRESYSVKQLGFSQNQPKICLKQLYLKTKISHEAKHKIDSGLKRPLSVRGNDGFMKPTSNLALHKISILIVVFNIFLTDFMKVQIVSPSMNRIHKIVIWCLFGLGSILCVLPSIITLVF